MTLSKIKLIGLNFTVFIYIPIDMQCNKLIHECLEQMRLSFPPCLFSQNSDYLPSSLPILLYIDY